ESWRRTNAVPHYTIFCSTSISRELSKRRSAIGASRCQQPLSMVSLFPHFPRRWLTSIVIAPLDYRQTFCRRNAISLVRTLTSESISPGYSTLNGSNRIRNQPKNQLNRKHQSRTTRESNAVAGPVGGLLYTKKRQRVIENRATGCRQVGRGEAV